MSSDFHVYMSDDDRAVTVKQDGIDAKMEFPSLLEATRHLRDRGTGFVVFHDAETKSANRIPLALAHQPFERNALVEPPN